MTSERYEKVVYLMGTINVKINIQEKLLRTKRAIYFCIYACLS